MHYTAQTELLREPPLVKDINTNANSNPNSFTFMGGSTYFIADDGVTGAELWKTNGTSSGTKRVKDINPGAASSNISDLVATNNTLYFLAEDGVSGKELWKSDGSEAGTLLIRDIYNGVRGSYPGGLTVVPGGILYFVADDGGTGFELWKSDGTYNGTALVRDINPGLGSSSPMNITPFNGAVYFSANDGTSPGWAQLWKTDGAEARTVRVMDFAPPVGSSVGGYQNLIFVTPDNQNCFTACTLFFTIYKYDTNESELWKSDGTTIGTTRVKNFGLDHIGSALKIGNSIYLMTANGNGKSYLWKSDGTDVGTVLVTGGDIRFDYYSLRPIGNMFFFAADDKTTGTELWKSDGTANGTLRVKDINPGGDTSYLNHLVVVGNKLYFTAYDGIHGVELWTSDGTETGTVLVKDINPGFFGSDPQSLARGAGNLADFLYFSAGDGVHGHELWVSDGTSAGTTMVKDIRTTGADAYPSRMVRVGNIWFFTADDGSGHGRELWRTDGTTTGTFMLKVLNPTGDSYPDYLTFVGSTLYFSAYDGFFGGLWKSDGTPEGTLPVMSNPGANFFSTYFLTAVGNAIYFYACGNTTGCELWKSDGTDRGTQLIKDIYPGTGPGYPGLGSGPHHLISHIGDTVYFRAEDGVTGDELWKTDGTETGTVQVKDINPGISESFMDYLTAVGNSFYFTAGSTIGLWKSDGTVGGTVLLKPLACDFNSVASIGNTFYFSASDLTGVSSGRELWKSDGTEAGTVQVKDINLGATGSSPTFLTAIGDTLYFSADDGKNGSGLWKSDGTESGTVLVKNVHSALLSNNPLNDSDARPSAFVTSGQILYFVADDGVTGMELWKSDGTEAGTERVTDINNGSRSGMLGILN